MPVTTTTAKVANYTPAMVKEMVEAYQNAGTDLTKEGHEKRAAVVAELAEKFGKEKRSIRSKLVGQKDSEGHAIYIKVAPESKVTEGAPEKKEVMAQNVANAFGVEVINGKDCRLNPASLEKMNKIELGILFHRFNSEIVDSVDEPETETAENGLGQMANEVPDES